MSILIDRNTRVMTQGITGKTGAFHTRLCRDYANGKSCFVAGVNPNKAGESFEGIPIFSTVKEAKERTKLSRAAQSLQEKVELQKEGAALKRHADDLQHQLYTRLREIDVERERMLDDIAEKLSLTPDSTTLFTIRWSLA